MKCFPGQAVIFPMIIVYMNTLVLIYICRVLPRETRHFLLGYTSQVARHLRLLISPAPPTPPCSWAAGTGNSLGIALPCSSLVFP